MQIEVCMKCLVILILTFRLQIATERARKAELALQQAVADLETMR